MSREISLSIAVFAVLIATVVFLSLFRPKSPEFFWRRLSETFATDRRLNAYAFKYESIFVRSALERTQLDAFFPWQYAHFDVGLDDKGLWLLFAGPDPAKCAESMFTPWSKIRFTGHWQDHYYLTILSKKPVGMTVRKPLGEAIVDYISR
jgi:hypothetical protein